MKLRIFGILALLLLPVSFAEAAPSQTPAAPRVEIEKVRYAFDPVVEGTQVTHAFSVRNTGNAPLVIKNVRTG
ncbi:MAG: DUF1573 domain-containing protein [Desulfobacterales bacterium]|nr:DUF1573 domain-containing protein [Desulfobacterales bacterium]MCF8078719.1 DUF1573 domain-containing protein [Desulfobacterales bacterium]